ncbi:EI24 domain-containing protein [Sedimentimonas flavescens]|uniref:EI24 domain-containing protein n=1 Tax=Sedimentimonas flavescens TaxID=2851012 RepID=UPI001C49E789|nr:EI24 domain-containing protein [Sedimentimonas flavescens]MBW0156695.1 EI24 domain-containing protein [Sedimentimonas flavescens]
MIFQSFLTGWADLFRPGSMKVLLKGIGLALALLVTLWLVLVQLIGFFVPDTITLPWIGEIGWVDSALSFASIGLMLVLSVFLMVPVASIFTGFFLEDVAEIVEDAHYSNLPAVRKLTLAETFGDTLRFFGVIVAANLVALMIYPFVIPLAPFLFFGLNGYLLGREYFQMAAFRRMHRDEAKALYEHNRTTIWVAGALMAVPLSVPLVNLAVPVVGAATFTHLFHALRRR